MADELDTRPPYRWALVTFVVIFGIYGVTLSPTTAFWDTSEYIAAAKVLGIPHPPGNPLFTLMAHVWGLLPLAASYAKRINFFAAATSAGGAALWFLVTERWLRPLLPAAWPRRAAAFAGVFAAAMAWTVWNQSTVNEKVYTVSLLSIALIAWCVVRWADQPPEARRDRYLVAAVYLLALTSTNHLMGVLVAPLAAVYVLFTDWRVILRPRVIAAVVIVAIVGLSLNYIYLPLRAAQYPPINEGEPIGFFSKALRDVLSRVQYGKPPVTQRMSPFGAQLAMYWQYWSWQWGRDLGSAAALATGVFSAFSLVGLWALIKGNRRAGWAAAALAFTLTLLLIYYLNFRYGFSYQPTNPTITGTMREVRERDYFFVASFAFAGVLIAAGFAAAMRGIYDWMGERGTDRSRWLASSSVLLLALVPLFGNRITAPRNHETLARDFAIDMLESVEPYGILITAGDNDTFPLWFAQEVLGVRRDVTLANLSLMNTDWHLRQIRRRQTPAFDPATAPAIWQRSTDTSAMPLGGPPGPGGWRKPTTPALLETQGWLDSLQDEYPVGSDTLSIGNITLHFGTTVLTRSDIATILLMRDNFGKRPIYFSLSDGDYPDSAFGLEPYLVDQGMVRKLMPGPVKAGGPILTSPYFNFIDGPRTRTLLFGVYHPEAADHSRPRGWFDPPSSSILTLYQIVYSGAAPALLQMGDSALAARSQRIADSVALSLPH